MKRRRKGWKTRMGTTITLQVETKPPYVYDHWTYGFENRSWTKWDLRRPVVRPPTSRELLEEEMPEMARAVLHAELKSEHKHHKTLSLIYVIWHKHNARISVTWLMSSLSKHILGYIKFLCRQQYFFCSILLLTSHNILCHDRENTFHKALQGASTNKKNTLPETALQESVTSDFKNHCMIHIHLI